MAKVKFVLVAALLAAFVGTSSAAPVKAVKGPAKVVVVVKRVHVKPHKRRHKHRRHHKKTLKTTSPIHSIKPVQAPKL